MPLSFSLIFQDSVNFIRNHFRIIFPMLLLVAVIGQWLDQLLEPDVTAIGPIFQLMENAIHTYGDSSVKSIQLILKGMEKKEQQRIIGLIVVFTIKYGSYKFLLGQIIVIICLALIWQLATHRTLEAKTFRSKMLNLILPVLVFMLVSIPYFLGMFILSSFVPPLSYFIIPCGLLFYTVMYNLFLIYIVNNPVTDTFKGISMAFTFLKKQYRAILPIFALWLAVKIIVNVIMYQIGIDSILVLYISNMLNLILYFFLLTYLYRLYILAKSTL